MRTDIKPSDDDVFQRRLREKDSEREELFAPENRDSVEANEYVHQQTVIKPKRIHVGKPGFKPKF